MATRINKLTPEQEALLPAQRDHWLATGLSTQPANRPEAERGVKLAYEAAGLPAPKFIIWVNSPYAGAFAQAMAPDVLEKILKNVPDQVRAQVWDQVWDQVGDQVWDQVGDQVRDQVGAQVRDQVWAQVRAQVRDQVWDQVGDQVGDQVWDQVGDQVWDQVGAQVRDQVRAQVRDQVRAQVWAQVWDQVGDQVWAQVRDQVGDQVGDQVWDQVGAQVRDQVRAQVWAQVGDHGLSKATKDRLNNWNRAVSSYYDSYFSSWIDTMRKLGVENLELWEGQQVVASNAYWWWTFRHFAVISERPKELARDRENRLHSETGHAITFPDGWGFHSWHGRRVPAWVIENPTVEQIMAEPNAEIRRCGIESMGWPQFIRDSGMTQVGEPADDPGNPGQQITLYDIPRDVYGDPVRVLVATNGTVERDGSRHTFGLTVPESISSPVAAAAWGYGLTATEYASAQRRA